MEGSKDDSDLTWSRQTFAPFLLFKNRSAISAWSVVSPRRSQLSA